MSVLFLNAAVVSKEQMLFLHSIFSLCSYCHMNTFYCSQYRSYNKGVPSNLHYRQPELVLYCLERLKIAMAPDLSVITCQGKV